MRLTIFTPSYNRAKLLGRLYESLIRQTNGDFEWLIVDDGSTDDTKSLVQSYIDEKKLDIRYIYRENGGKMRAHNTGAVNAKGELFLCVDSDDYLTDTAVDDLLNCYDENKLQSPDVGGVVAHKGESEDKLLGDSDFPAGGISTLYGLYLNGFSGETTLMYETELLRKYPFPEIDGEKYVPEDYIYDKIDRVCRLAILNKIITVCEIVSEGYTDSVARLRRDNPKAWYLYYEQRARITPWGVLRVKYLGRYIIYAKRSGESVHANKDISAVAKLVGYIYAGALIIIRKE